MKEGLRYNEGKTRHDLIPQFAQEQYAKVLTKGSEKYAERNWELGMKWSKVTASLKRHTAAFERGEDFDKETGLLHTAHIMCNAAFLTEYYKIYPQGDDRPHEYLNRSKIGLDIDEVLADWVGHWTKFHGQEVPESWNFDRNIKDKFESLKDDKDFWLSIPVKTKPSDIHFEPHCYITSRSIPAGSTPSSGRITRARPKGSQRLTGRLAFKSRFVAWWMASALPIPAPLSPPMTCGC